MTGPETGQRKRPGTGGTASGIRLVDKMMPNLPRSSGMNQAMTVRRAKNALKRLEAVKTAGLVRARMGRPPVLKVCDRCNGKMPARQLLRHRGTCTGTPPEPATASTERTSLIGMADLAKLLGVTRETLRLWQVKNVGPKARPESRRVYYYIPDVEEFLRERALGHKLPDG